MDFLPEMLKTFGVPGILGVAVSALVLWWIADRVAKPGTEVSVLWGLVKYVKRGGEQPLSPTPSSPGGSITEGADVVGGIRSEAPGLLSVTRSIPGGLWLTAESVSVPRDSLLLTAQQIKQEYRAEALAHLSLALTVFNKPKDARQVAEQSLSAATNARDAMRSFTYAKLVEKFLEADLTPFAQQAAQRAVELALEKARADKNTENFRYVTEIYARAFSPNKALDVARAVPDPKGQGEALAAVIAQYIEGGNGKEAANIIEEALVVSQKILKTSDRAHAYSQRAQEWMRIGRYDEAAKTAKQAKKEAQQIDPQELFGEVMRTAITNDMNLLEVHPLNVLRAAEAQGNPRVLTYLAKFLPKRAHETIQIAKSAMNMAVQNRMPDVLADTAQLLDAAGLAKEAQQAAQKTMDFAVNAADRFRDMPLQKAAETLSKGGDYENALSAVASISTPKQGAETILRVLLNSYARTGKTSAKAIDIIHRLQIACATLDDKDRSAAMMQLAAGMAFLGNMQEAYKTAKQSLLSGHRLSAYAIILLTNQMQSLPAPEVTKIHSARGEAFEKMLLPIFSWDLVS